MKTIEIAENWLRRFCIGEGESEGGWIFFIENPKGGGHLGREGGCRGARRVSAENWRGGANFFFFGAEFTQDNLGSGVWWIEVRPVIELGSD